MKVSALSRFWSAFAIIPLMMGFAFASGPAMFLCKGDLVARAACCCPGDHGSGAQGAPVELSTNCCCDLSQIRTPVILADALSRATAPLNVQPFVQIATLDVVWRAPGSRVWSPSRFSHPPPGAIPILLGKQSLLI